MREIETRSTVFRGPENRPRYDLLRNEEDRNVSCAISHCWVLSLSETVKKTRLGLIYEGIHGLTFSKQFICSSVVSRLR